MSIFSKAKAKVKSVAKKVVAKATSVAKGAVNLVKNTLSKNVVSSNVASVGSLLQKPSQSSQGGLDYSNQKSNVAPNLRNTITPTSFNNLVSNPNRQGQLDSGNNFSNSSGGVTYGPAKPTTLSKSSSPKVQQSSLAGQVKIPQTIGANTLNQRIGINAGSPINLSTPTALSNPGAVNNAGLTNSLSETYNYTPTTNTFDTKDLSVDPYEEQAKKDREAFQEILDLQPRKEDINDSREIRKQREEVLRQRQIVGDYTSQLNSVVAKQNQDLLSLRQVGSQEGVTEAVYGGQALTINREAAIKALPIQAAVASAQGNLELAQDYLSEITAMKKEEIENDYSYKMSQYNAISDFAKGEQKTRLERLKLQEDRKYKESEKLIGIQESLMQSASSQGASPQIISRIAGAKTRQEAFVAAGKYAGDILDREYKQAQLDKIYADIAEKNEDNTVVVDQEGKIVLKPASASKLNKELINNDAYKVIRKGQDSLQYVNEFERKLQAYGSTSEVFDPIKNSDLKASYNTAILNLKEFFNLGVLNGPDETILRGIVPDPTDRSNFAKAIRLGTYQPGTASQLGVANIKKQIETTLDDRFKSISAQYGDYSADSLNSLKDLQRVYISQKVQINPEIATLIEENPDLTYEDIINVITE